MGCRPSRRQSITNSWKVCGRRFPAEACPPAWPPSSIAEKLVDTPPVIKAPEVWTRSNELSDTPHWTIPGPAAGPFQARLDNGMVVTYHWYRFRDQPALQYADLTEAELSKLQTVAEKIHQAWTIDGSYLAEPTMGTLADVDPALLVTPPPGMEVGYVPIPSRQEWGGFVNLHLETGRVGQLECGGQLGLGNRSGGRRSLLLQAQFQPVGDLHDDQRPGQAGTGMADIRSTD